MQQVARTLAALLVMAPLIGNAGLIDNSTSTGDINSGWDRSAQTLVFETDVTLDSFGWWLGQVHTHQVSIVEWAGGPGTTLWSTTESWSSGFNEILPNVSLSAGIVYAVYFDYLGSISDTVHFGSNLYADGTWWLSDRPSGAFWSEFSHLDMRFVASYSDAVSVSEPATLALLGFGLAGMGFARRRRKA
ncbi:MAG: PEP-CTERM sorting domain-containing protein [Woeseia sp.]